MWFDHLKRKKPYLSAFYYIELNISSLSKLRVALNSHLVHPFYVWWLRWWRIHPQYGRHGFDLWVGKIPRRKKQLPTPVFWPGEFHRLYSSWAHKSWTQVNNLHLISRMRVKVWVKFEIYGMRCSSLTTIPIPAI